MIKNILFDFGDVFINLDKSATIRTLASEGITEIPDGLLSLANSYERGDIETAEFLKTARQLLPGLTRETIIKAWNAIILDFPDTRLQFLQNLVLQKNYRLFLLSNTNELHIEKVKTHMGIEKYNAFKLCFEGFYLSHLLGMAKPEEEIFNTILRQHELQANETLFVDDTLIHIQSAQRLGFRTWHLNVGKEEVTELNSHL